ncbi:hypothetical protein NWE55_13435 [Myroides albus]|uniref:hypothetical protein n=1 Tax=Myroides albus TaxID=2562892 RepID=UPI002158AFFD|nr:hypothetical protein [Myroides albus]UVD79115.1 hypothetical protein NWE55_13435 [Myroides albus]
MKNYIKNLFTGLAVIAMLSVGAFTVNASELKKDSKKENPVVESVKANNPYSGPTYYREFDTSLNEYVYVYVGDITEGECTLDLTEASCKTIVDGTERILWGEISPNNYSELHKQEEM